MLSGISAFLLMQRGKLHKKSHHHHNEPLRQSHPIGYPPASTNTIKFLFSHYSGAFMLFVVSLPKYWIINGHCSACEPFMCILWGPTSAMWLACHELNSTLFPGPVFDLSIRCINMAALRLSILGNGFVGEKLLQNFVSAISCYILKETFPVYASLRQSRHRSQPTLAPLAHPQRQLFPTIEMHILCSLEINKEIIAIGVINRRWRTRQPDMGYRFRETFRAIYPRRAGAECCGGDSRRKLE